MNWITTNIRFPEDQYMELKMTALKERKSVAALIREKMATKSYSRKNTNAILRQLDRVAKANAESMKGKSLSKLLIEMRYEQ